MITDAWRPEAHSGSIWMIYFVFRFALNSRCCRIIRCINYQLCPRPCRAQVCLTSVDDMNRELPEEDMSLCHIARSGRVQRIAALLMMAVGLLAIQAVAQDDAVPKAELFAGYQWLNPGGTVPAPFHPQNDPLPLNLKDIPQGAGTSFTWNFTKVF